MKKIGFGVFTESKPAVQGLFALAIAFTFSCSGGGGGNGAGDDGGDIQQLQSSSSGGGYNPQPSSSSGGGYSSGGIGNSSSSGPSSSSAPPPSSSSGCTAIDNTTIKFCLNGEMKNYSDYANYSYIEYAGQIYRTVEIGTQTWMAENLNYDVNGSACYDNDPANCAKYGRLYDWATAMDICPSGWHIPSSADWDQLFRYVDGTTGTSSPYSSPTAGKHLKAASGWNDYYGIPAGTDDFGFSALPGASSFDGDFYGVGDYGSWWSRTDRGSQGGAYSQRMVYHNEYTSHSSYDKSNLFSVRCLKGTPSSSSGCTAIDNTTTKFCLNGEMKNYSDYADYSYIEYEGQVYRTVLIGTQTWMAENLNYNASGSRCYDNSSTNCPKYGRLYDWATAMAGSASSIANPSGVQGICPSGWHIPSDDEWDVLMTEVGGSSTAGKHLKAQTGWNENGNGLDTYGFTAMPGGSNPLFPAGNSGVWWSSSESESLQSPLLMRYDDEVALHMTGSGSFLFSVRCVKD